VTTTFLILLALGVLALNALAIFGALRLIRWSENRRIRTAAKTSVALSQIPRVRRFLAYLAVGLVLSAVMAWNYGTGGVVTGSVVVGVAALTYLVWFSFRWRHLR